MTNDFKQWRKVTALWHRHTAYQVFFFTVMRGRKKQQRHNQYSYDRQKGARITVSKRSQFYAVSRRSKKHTISRKWPLSSRLDLCAPEIEIGTKRPISMKDGPVDISKGINWNNWLLFRPMGPYRAHYENLIIKFWYTTQMIVPASFEESMEIMHQFMYSRPKKFLCNNFKF